MSEVVGEAVVVIRTDETQVDGPGAGKRAGGGFVSGFGGALKGLAAGAGVAAVAVGVSKVFTGALNFDAAGAKMEAQLGLTEAQSADAGRVAGTLFSDNYGAGLEEVQGAVGSVISSIEGMRGASEKELEAASRAALGYADVFNTDIEQAVSGASRLISSGLAKDSVEAFDLLTRASQKVPAELREDMFDAVNEYSQFFDQIGLGGEEAFSTLTAASDRGMFGIDKAGDAVKEFTIRSTDMSKTSTDAYKAIGLDAQEMSNAILAGGDQAGEATSKIIDGLLGVKDPSDQAMQAIALFGTPLEDLGTKNIPEFLQSLQGTGDAMGDVAGATEDAVARMSDTPLARIQGMWRQFQGGVMSIANEALPPILDGFDDLLGLVEDFAPVAQSALGPLMDELPGVAAVVASLAGSLGTSLEPVIDSIASTVTTTLVPALMSLWGYAQENLVPVFLELADIVVTSIVPTLATLAAIIYTTVVPALIQIGTFVAEKLRPVLTQLAETFMTQILPAIRSLSDDIRTRLIPALQPIIEKITRVVSAVLGFAAAVLSVLLPPLIRFAGWVIATLVPVLVDIVVFVVKVIDKVLAFGGAVAGIIGTVFRFGGALVGLARDGIGGVVSAVTALPRKILELIPRMLGAGKRLIKAFVNGLANAGGFVADIAGNIWSAVKGFLNDAIDKINLALEFTIKVPGPDIKIDTPDIPHLATGTSNFGGGWAVVGEQGRELVNLPRGAQVIPNGRTEDILGRPGDDGPRVYIGQMMPHNYSEFERQINEQSRLASLGGRRPVTV